MSEDAEQIRQLLRERLVRMGMSEAQADQVEGQFLYAQAQPDQQERQLAREVAQAHALAQYQRTAYGHTFMPMPPRPVPWAPDPPARWGEYRYEAAPPGQVEIQAIEVPDRYLGISDSPYADLEAPGPQPSISSIDITATGLDCPWCGSELGYLTEKGQRDGELRCLWCGHRDEVELALGWGSLATVAEALTDWPCPGCSVPVVRTVTTEGIPKLECHPCGERWGLGHFARLVAEVRAGQGQDDGKQGG